MPLANAELITGIVTFIVNLILISCIKQGFYLFLVPTTKIRNYDKAYEIDAQANIISAELAVFTFF